MPSHQGTCVSPTITGKVFEGNAFNPVARVVLVSDGKLEISRSPGGETIIGGGDMPWAGCTAIVSNALVAIAKDQIMVDGRFECKFDPSMEGQKTVLLPSMMLNMAYAKVAVEHTMGYRELVIVDKEDNVLCHIYINEFPKFVKGKLYTINGVKFTAIKDFDYIKEISEVGVLTGDIVDYLEKTGCVVKILCSQAKAYTVAADINVISEAR